MDSHWVHNLSPFAIHLWGNVGIRWYGLAYLAGILGGYWFLRRWHRQGRNPLDVSRIQDFALYGGLGMIVGGRLGYCLIYGRDVWAQDPLYFFKLWEGGMASHGGIIGLVLGSWFYARNQALPMLLLTDMVSAVAPVGVFFGRLANFVNGELPGKVSDVPWAVIFPQAPDHLPRHPSQLYAAGLEGLVLFVIIVPFHARHRKPGMTTGLTFTLYAIVRFISEFWRAPDVGQPPLFGWMNTGQALSLPVLALGLGILVWSARRPSRPEVYREKIAPSSPDLPPSAPPAPQSIN